MRYLNKGSPLHWSSLGSYLLQFAFFVSFLVFDYLRKILGTVQGNFFSCKRTEIYLLEAAPRKQNMLLSN